MGYTFAELSTDGLVAVVTMNRPDRLNALGEDLEIDVCAALLDAERDPSVRVIVLTGAGRAFCAGHDLQGGRSRPPESGIDRAASVRRRTSRLLRATLSNQKPVIARVHGYCLAAGTDLMSMCDFAIASDDATFGYPVLRVNPRLPSSLWPWQIGIPRAKELVFTGDVIPAERSLAIGMINHVVPRDDLEDFTHRLAMRVALSSSKRVQKEWLNSILWSSLGLPASLETIYQAWEPEVRDEVQEAWVAALRGGGVSEAVRWRNERFDPFA